MRDWIDDLFRRVGQPVPCDLCGTPTAAADLTESVIADRVLDFGVPGVRSHDPELVILRRVIWVLTSVPVIGPGGSGARFRPAGGTPGDMAV